MHASARSTKNILIWRWWWRTRTPPSGRSSSPLTSWPTSPSGCLWTGSTRDGKKDVLKITLKLDKIETHIKFCKVPTKPVTQPRVSEVIQCVINKSWHHAKSLKYRHELSKFYANQKGEKKTTWDWNWKCVDIRMLSITESNQPNTEPRQSEIQS